MRAIWTLVANDLRLLLRDRTAAAFTFVVPVLFAVLFGALFAIDSPKLAVVVVDADDTDGSRDFAERLAASSELEVTRMSRSEALRSVRRGDWPAAVILEEGFGQSFGQLLAGGTATIDVRADPARQVEVDMLEGLLTRTYIESLIALSGRPDELRREIQAARLLLSARALVEGEPQPLDPLLGELDRYLAGLESDGESGPDGDGSAGEGWWPLRIERSTLTADRSRPRNPYEVSFPQGLIWGLIGCTASFATSLADERSRGTLVRIRMSPVSQVQILAGKALSCFLTGLAIMVLLLALGVAAFGLDLPSVPLFVLVAGLVGAAFTGMMMLLALLGRSERGSSGLAWAVLVIMAMFGGGMMPLFFMPEWMQTVSHASPVKWAVLAIEGVVWRGLSVAELLPALGILAGISLVSFAFALRTFRTSA